MYRDAASSSGILTTQQIRATSEAERYTKALQKQNLTFSDMRRHSGIMKEVYRDQLRYQRMTAQYWGTDQSGRAITDISIPRNVPKDLDTVAQKLHFTGQMASSAGTQIVNYGKNMQWAGRQLTVGFTYPVALFGAAAGAMAYKVEDAFGSINKVYDYSARALNDQNQLLKEQGELRAQSFEMATEVAGRYGLAIEKTLEVEQELAATGLIGQKLIDSTKEVQRISTLGDVDPGATTEMIIALQTAFRGSIKDGDDLTNTLNFMNAASNATSLSLEDIVEATPRAASGMAALGGTAEDMTILLVSMREAGVNAAEGANALKSATARILNDTILNKATKIYQGFGANIDVGKISEESEGNMFQFIKLLGEAQEANTMLTDKQKQSAVAALFGTYQFNRLTAALTNTADAYAGVENQTAKALEIQEAGSDAWAKMAKNSEEAMTSTPAAKFRKEWQLLRIELVEVGQPFLELATVAAGAGKEVLGFFNNLSDGQKKVIAVIAGVAAVAGPIVMAGGLFMNLVGQFVSGSGKILTFVGRAAGAVGLLNKEEQAATLTAQAQNKALLAQQKNTTTLANEIAVLSAAYAKATRAAAAFTTAQVGANTPTAKVYSNGLNNAQSFDSWRNKTNTYESARDLGEQLRNQKTNQLQINKLATGEEKIRAGIASRVNGTNLGIAAMSASMAGMMLFNNEFVNSISKWLMIGSLVVPAIKVLASTLGVAASEARRMAIEQITAARASAANVAGLTRSGRAMGTIRAGAAGLASGVAATLGKSGMIGLGLVAVYGAYRLVTKGAREAREESARVYRESEAAAKRVESSTRDWVQNMGEVAGEYERVAEAQNRIGSGSPTGSSEQQKLIDYYKTVPEGGDKSPVDDYKKIMNSSDLGFSRQENEFALVMAQKFVDLQVEGQMKAGEAADHMRALYIALGASADIADSKAQDLVTTWGDVRSSMFDWQGFVEQQSSLFANAAPAQMETAAKNASEAFWAGMANSRSEQQARSLLTSFVGDTQSSVEDAYNNMIATWGNDGITAWFAEIGVKNVEDFAALLRSTSMEELEKMMDNSKAIAEANAGKNITLPYERIIGSLEGANREQDRLLNGLDSIVHFGDDVNSIFDLKNWNRIQALTVGYDNQKKILMDINGTLTDQKGLITGTANAQQIATLEAFNTANGFKIGKTWAETLSYFVNRVAADTGRAAKEVDAMGNELEDMPTMLNVKISTEQSVGIAKTAMENVQSRMADSAMETFNSRWDSRLEGVQATWDSRSDAMTARHKAAQDAMEKEEERAQESFDNRWKKRKESLENDYKNRMKRIDWAIKREQRADAIRQRIFENEKNRLSRLAEMANTNIDFNQALNEGRLDDAAKTLNNANANAGNAQMDAEQASAERLTEARIESLQKKNERLEAQRDREVKSLEKMEERMRKHLGNVQEARRKALEKQQSDEVKALDRSEKAAMKSLDRQRNYERAILDERLTLFKSYTARNQADLEKWMGKVGLAYEDFGSDVKAKGKDWSQHFRTELSTQIRAAGVQVMNNNIWEKVGENMARKLVQGMGFEGLADFNRFVRTGKRKERKEGSGPAGKFPETRHTGGVIGQGNGSRGNIPNSYKGLHRTETMVRAQKGEFVMPVGQTQKNLGLLEAIRQGSDVPMPGDPAAKGVQGGYGGPAGIVASAVSQMFMQGAAKAMKSEYMRAAQQAAALANPGGTFSGLAGSYGGRAFNAEQMKNAAIIASVGSGMGMSARDLQIGIMTAITESGLINVNYGDRDSLGLFQQRPSMGWGTAAQVTDPYYASKKFFSVLKADEDRNSKTPWMAAQGVQRSYAADGHNFKKWWEAAQALFTKGLKKQSAADGGGYVPGKGGKHKPVNSPVTSGLHGGNTAGNPPAVDMAVPVGKPVYAVADGVITQSKDIAGPLPTDRFKGDGPYGSFGRMIQLHTDSGAYALYAHLSRRSVAPGQRVTGGSTIGYTGNTGNSSGPHLHFGATNGPFAWLRKGGTVKHDDTPAFLHRGETVLTDSLTRKFKDNVASGGANQYNVNIDLSGSYIKEDVDIKAAVKVALRDIEKQKGQRRVID